MQKYCFFKTFDEYRLENEYCYIINWPDVPYEDIREIDSSSLILLDYNGDDISGEGN